MLVLPTVRERAPCFRQDRVCSGRRRVKLETHESTVTTELMYWFFEGDCTRNAPRTLYIRDVIGHPPYSVPYGHGAREIGGSH